MLNCRIAGLNLLFENVEENILKRFFYELWLFLYEQGGTKDFIFKLEPTDTIACRVPETVFNGDGFGIEKGGKYTFRSEKGNTFCMCDLKNRKAVIQYVRDERFLDISSQIANVFMSFLAQNNGIFMHGPILKHKEKAVIFTAASGGGKSTQANYWSECFGDELINGDKAIVRLIDGKSVAFGSPWSGSSYICKNESAPLKAIVLIVKAEKNSIERVTDAQHILSVLAPNVYYPYWSDELVDKTTDTMEELIGKVSFWILRCRNEKESAILAEQSIFAEDYDA